MNCETCISQKVCFLQKQIGSLADRTADVPFNDGFRDIGGDRTEDGLRKHERMVAKQDEIYRKLRGVIASSCSLYLQSDCPPGNTMK